MTPRRTDGDGVLCFMTPRGTDGTGLPCFANETPKAGERFGGLVEQFKEDAAQN